jgi:hypothetical protein
MEYLRNLGSPSVYRGKDPIQETLQRSEPPQGIDQTSWLIFINRIMGELNTVLREVTKTPKYSSELNPVLGSVPSMPDMLKLAEPATTKIRGRDELNSRATIECH